MSERPTGLEKQPTVLTEVPPEELYAMIQSLLKAQLRAAAKPRNFIVNLN